MVFKYIDIERLKANKKSLQDQWNAPKPFSYLVYDGLFRDEMADIILAEYPEVDKAVWENTTYINQKNKFEKTNFDDKPIFEDLFSELNSPEFLKTISEITGIEDLLGDKELFGAGLHQSIKGAFLDVHVDFNIHPAEKWHRRLNVLIYMNKDWKKDYNGYLELWDMDKNVQIENIEPAFNRCVIFETNEVSFHGHPKPLKTPVGVSRKSISAYYYTTDRPANEIADEHNTIYVNTEGSRGFLKNLKSGIKAFFERLSK